MRFGFACGDGSAIGVEMSGNCVCHKGKRAHQVESSHFRVAARRMRLTPWGCQLNVGLNSKKFTPRETNAPPGAVRAPHVERFDAICVTFPRPSGSGAFLLFSEPLWR
jgi:hypothetical protein